MSGLSCAINLALGGKEVVVFERNPSVGLQVHENYQVLQTRGKTAGEYLASLNLKPDFHHLSLDKTIFSTSSRDLPLNLKQEVFFVQRGGKNSLEDGLFRQAAGLGVRFQFNSHALESEAEVVATGPRRVDAAAFGAVYENTDFPRDRFLMMYDDRYSPRGWYLYIIPFSENKVEVVNCASQPHAGRVRDLFHNALQERAVLKKYFDGAKPVSTFGGFGNVGIPKSAIKNGSLIVGEAAGFQDPFRGFGMNFALESGRLAAEAILRGVNYDALWRKSLMPQFKLDYSRRFFVSILGSGLIDLMYRGTKSGDTIGFKSGDVGGAVGSALKSVFFQAELAKKRITGFW